jgi:hypothetical protein
MGADHKLTKSDCKISYLKRRRSLSPAELAEEVYEATEIFSSETMLRSSSTIPSDPIQVLFISQ